ncbi:MAG: hypothetical protein ACRD3P_10865 [Terriglobales bacterium]
MNRTLGILCMVLIALALSAQTAPQNTPGEKPSADAQVPVIDGAVGPCSLELTILGADSKPVYNATVKVHITYGFGGFHHLDLQAGTNSDGKVKFTGIPAKVHNPPLEFGASKDALEGSVNYDPLNECHGKHDLHLEKSKPQDQQ